MQTAPSPPPPRAPGAGRRVPRIVRAPSVYRLRGNAHSSRPLRTCPVRPAERALHNRCCLRAARESRSWWEECNAAKIGSNEHRDTQSRHRSDASHLSAAHAAGARGQAPARRRYLPHLPPHVARRPQAHDDQGRRHPREREGCVRADHGTEMGKTLKAAVEEAEKCALGCRYYAEHAEEFLRRRAGRRRTRRAASCRYQPLGAVLAVMPWNFPVLAGLPLRRAGADGRQRRPAQACVERAAVRARASRTSFARAGFPDGCLSDAAHRSPTRRAVSSTTARVAAVTLTGSEGAGREVAQRGGQAHQEDRARARRQRPVHRACRSADLERGGRDGGQGAHHQQRPVVHRGQALHRRTKRSTTIRAALRRRDASAPRGRSDGRRPPISARWPRGAGRDDHRRAGGAIGGGGRQAADRRQARSIGAGILLRAHRARRTSPPNAPAYHDEVFGPVAIVFRARDLDDAIRLANDSPFGLGASAWTTRRRRARSGSCASSRRAWCSSMRWSPPIPRLPFGGVKQSGYGRELAGFGLREFVNIKSVWIQDAAPSSQKLSDSE